MLRRALGPGAYTDLVQVAFDEQIFALQEYGGISRLFTELARQYLQDPSLDVELLPLNAPVINRYALDDRQISTALGLRQTRHEYYSLLRYLCRLMPRPGNDIVHNTFYLPHGLSGYPGAKRVITVYDMIPERLPQTRRRLDLLTLKHRYVMNADHVICISDATKADLLATYGDIDVPISVVHLGVDARFRPGVPRFTTLPDNYILFVGNRGQYKDAEVLLRAFSELAKAHPDITLLFVGGGSFTAAEERQLAERGIVDRVEQLALTDDAMPAAYGNALMTVFPSRFEGFGLPALESMACGVPTILARATSLPEVGGNAAVYFTPGVVHELVEVISMLLTDPSARSQRSSAGIERASAFTWHKCAQETADVYSAVLNES